jgi:CBS domain-containing protein/ribosome-associated translation inhibitor RaiA
MKIDDMMASAIMSKHLVVAEKEEELSEVLGRMKKHKIHEIPVVSRKRLLGIVSYETLMKRKNIPLTTKVEKIMSLPPRITMEERLPEIAEALMVGGHRALPVTSDSKVMGIISRMDIVKAMRDLKELKNTKLEKIMTPSPHCIREDDDILEARNLMKSLDERSIPVVDDSGRLTGVIGHNDLVELFMRAKDKRKSRVERGTELNLEVKGVMRRPPIFLSPESMVIEAVRLMLKNEISSVIVVEDRKPVGIVTQVDLLELVVSYRESPQLYVQITGLEEDPELYDAMYAIIRKTMKRLSNIVKPKILNLHIVQHHDKGLRNKSSLRARLFTDKKMYYAKAFEWDVIRALDEVMKQLDKAIKREKDIRIDKRKSRKKM